MIWLDNHLSPSLARWIEAKLGEPCLQVRDVGLASAGDAVIFARARAEARVLITKDRDFAELVDRLGPPPAIILLTSGNTSTSHLQVLLDDRLKLALALIASGERLVEIGGST